MTKGTREFGIHGNYTPGSVKKYIKSIGSSYSNWSEIKCRIPQVSRLEHLLLNIFIKNLFFAMEKSNICNFVD